MRFIRRFAFVVVLAAVLSPDVLHAQQTPTLAVGARVRVAMKDLRSWRVGTVAALSGDALGLQLDGDESPPLTIRLADVGRLEIADGQRRPYLAGLGWGLVIGGAGGAIGGGIAAATCTKSGFENRCIDTAGGALLGGVAGGLAGGIVGLIVGAFSTEDDWTRVPSVSLTGSATRGPGVRFAIRF